jgi:lysophospholipase L1-like esterase
MTADETNISPVDLLVVGDSLSDGLWRRDRAGLGTAWPGILHRLLLEAGNPRRVANRAEGGFRSIEVLASLRDDSSIAYRAVAVLVGANDVWRRWVPWRDQAPVDEDDFRRNLRRIAEVARGRGCGEFLFLSPTLLHADPDHPWNETLREYRAICREVATLENGRYVPTGEEFEAAVRLHPDVKWTYDGVHPRPVGQERLAWTVFHHAFGGAQLSTSRVPERPSDHRLGSWP